MLLVLLCLSRSQDRAELVRSVREVVEPRGMAALTRPAELTRLLRQILPTLLVVDDAFGGAPAELPVLRIAPDTAPETLGVAVREALQQLELDARSGRMFAARRRPGQNARDVERDSSSACGALE